MSKITADYHRCADCKALCCCKQKIYCLTQGPIFIVIKKQDNIYQDKILHLNASFITPAYGGSFGGDMSAKDAFYYCVKIIAIVWLFVAVGILLL